MGATEVSLDSFQGTAWEVITTFPAPWWVGQEVGRGSEGWGLVTVPDGGQTVLTQKSRIEPLAPGHTLDINAVQP